MKPLDKDGICQKCKKPIQIRVHCLLCTRIEDMKYKPRFPYHLFDLQAPEEKDKELIDTKKAKK